MAQQPRQTAFRLPEETLGQLDAIARRLPTRGRDMPATRTDAVRVATLMMFEDLDRLYPSKETTMDATYTSQIKAHVMHEHGMTVTLPDDVAADQAAHDGQEIEVVGRNGESLRAILRGDLYNLGQSGTGDPVVELID